MRSGCLRRIRGGRGCFWRRGIVGESLSSFRAQRRSAIGLYSRGEACTDMASPAIYRHSFHTIPFVGSEIADMLEGKVRRTSPLSSFFP